MIGRRSRGNTTLRHGVVLAGGLIVTSLVLTA
jgi:hypothetical protein